MLKITPPRFARTWTEIQNEEKLQAANKMLEDELNGMEDLEGKKDI